MLENDLLTRIRTCSMTFGRPPTVPNSYVLLERPLDIELEALDEHRNQISNLPQENQSSHSTAVIFIQSMSVERPRKRNHS